MNIRSFIRKVLSENNVFQPATEINYKNRKQVANHVYTVIGLDTKNELAILKGPGNKLYAFYYYPIGKMNFNDYAHLVYPDGTPELDKQTIENYLNDHIETLKKGVGMISWEEGEDNIVQIDNVLRDRLIQDFASSSSIMKALGKN